MAESGQLELCGYVKNNSWVRIVHLIFDEVWQWQVEQECTVTWPAAREIVNDLSVCLQATGQLLVTVSNTISHNFSSSSCLGRVLLGCIYTLRTPFPSAHHDS
jgi:hypothetical protein